MQYKLFCITFETHSIGCQRSKILIYTAIYYLMYRSLRWKYHIIWSNYVVVFFHLFFLWHAINHSSWCCCRGWRGCTDSPQHLMNIFVWKFCSNCSTTFSTCFIYIYYHRILYTFRYRFYFYDDISWVRAWFHFN